MKCSNFVRMDFDAIHRQYRPRVYRLCKGYAGDDALAEDLVQEIFISVWKNLHSLKNKSAVATWIFRIATNHCLRSVSKNRHRHVYPAELPDIPVAPANDKEEGVRQLYRCIAQLEEMDRIIISLVLEDIPQSEIAAITGLSETNTRVRVHRAKERLTKKIKVNGRPD